MAGDKEGLMLHCLIQWIYLYTHLFKFKLTKNDFNIPQSNSSVTLAIFQELTNHKCRRSTILENTNSITVKVLSNGAGSFNLVSKTQAQ